MSDFMSIVDSIINSMYRASLVYGLVAYYWITWACETGYIITHKTVCGAINAHRGQEFVFLARNSCPWQRHIQDEELGVLRIQYPLVYNVNNCHFEFPMPPMPPMPPMNPMNNEGSRSFSTVVTVELVNYDKSINFDLSSFFHELSWDACDAGDAGDAGEYSPSLFEVVLTYFLENDLLFTLDKISGFRLMVFTNDGEHHIVPLNSDFAMSNFEGWYENESPAPSATSEIEDSSAVVANVVEDIVAAVVEDSPAVVEDSPAVVEDSPAVVEDSPAVVEDSPAVVEDSPAVVEDSPAVVEDSPAVVEDSPAVVEDSPAVVEDSPAVVEDSPAVVPDDDRPHLETPPSASISDAPSVTSSGAFEA